MCSSCNCFYWVILHPRYQLRTSYVPPKSIPRRCPLPSPVVWHPRQAPDSHHMVIKTRFYGKLRLFQSGQVQNEENKIKICAESKHRKKYKSLEQKRHTLVGKPILPMSIFLWSIAQFQDLKACLVSVKQGLSINLESKMLPQRKLGRNLWVDLLIILYH